MDRKTLLYIAASLDGFIAGPGDDMRFLAAVQQEGEDYGYAAFMKTVDTVIMGRKTYDWVMKQVPEFPHASLNAYILTRTVRPAIGNTCFYNGSLSELLSRLRSVPGKHIFCDGGGATIHALLMEGLVDEMIISFIPVLLGGGTKLFSEGIPGQTLELVNAGSYPSGLVQLHYRVAREIPQK